MNINANCSFGCLAMISLLIDSTNLFDCDSEYNTSTQPRQTILPVASFIHQKSYFFLNFRSSHMPSATFSNLHFA